MMPVARADSELKRAVAAAKAGELDRALQQYEAARAIDEPSAEDVARLAKAFYDQGDVEDGARMVEVLGERQIPNHLADALNAHIAAHSETEKAYQEARLAVLRQDERAHDQVQAVLGRLQRIVRPRYPQTQDEFMVELAGDLLGPDSEPEDVAAAQALLQTVNAAELAPKKAVATAWASAFQGKKAEAGRALQGVDVSALPASWALLSLEARASGATAAEREDLVKAAAALAVPEALAPRKEALLKAPEAK
jgi:hypothetical protein